jgi:hypothetical protein
MEFSNVRFKKQITKGCHDPECSCDHKMEWDRRPAQGRKPRIPKVMAWEGWVCGY